MTVLCVCNPSSVCVFTQRRGGLTTSFSINNPITYTSVDRPRPTSRQVPGASVQPVIANLAVDRSIRRRGIGKRILRECERVVKGVCVRANHALLSLCPSLH